MVFNKDWFIENQTLLKWFANTSYGKGVLGHGLDKVDFILPNAVFQKQDNKVKAEFRTHNKYGKRLFYEYQPIWRAFHWFDENVANVYVPRLNLGFDTLTAYPDADPETTTVDGYVGRTTGGTNQTDIRTGAGTTVNATSADTSIAYAFSHSTSGNFTWCRRGIFLFDTSSIGSGATIDSATISFYGTLKSNSMSTDSLCIVSSDPASNTALAASDYDINDFGTTKYATMAYASYSTSAYNDLSLDANGIAQITKGGVSKFGTRLEDDIDGTLVWNASQNNEYRAYHADQTGTANDPKLVVTYTVPGGIYTII